MGLDQYAYVANKAGQLSGIESKTRIIAKWRKHPNLQGWMEMLWFKKGSPTRDLEYDAKYRSSFNGVELELTWEDIDDLEIAIKNKELPATSGFFFGNNSDDQYYNHDLTFVRNARTELFSGLKVFYNSSW